MKESKSYVKLQGEAARKGLELSALEMVPKHKTLAEFDAEEKQERGISVLPYLPSHIRNMWERMDAQQVQMHNMIESYGKRIRSEMQVIQEPLSTIGQEIVKRSGKPFKGGETIVRVTSIVDHPHIDGHAFSYDYLDEHGNTLSSYISIASAKLAI